MRKLTELERKILIYLDSEEPFSRADQIAKSLKADLDKVQAALVRLSKEGLIQEKDGLWFPTNEIIQRLKSRR